MPELRKSLFEFNGAYVIASNFADAENQYFQATGRSRDERFDPGERITFVANGDLVIVDGKFLEPIE